MKNVRMLPVALLALGLATSPARAERPGHGLDLTLRDTTCAPCRDFYQYANGAWLDHAAIPGAYDSYGVSDELEDRNRESLRALLEDAVRAVGRAPKGSNTEKLGIFYGGCMDSARAEAEGAKPLEPELARIAAIGSLADLAPAIARMHLTGLSAMFSGGAAQDIKNSEQYIAGFYQGGLGMPDRDYYTRQDSAAVALRAAYVDHIARTYVLLGDASDAARAAAEKVMALETALAEASMTAVQRRDPKATYHKMPVAELAALAPSFPWKAYLGAMGLPGVDSVNVAQPEFFKTLSARLQQSPLEDWKAYLRWNAARFASPVLSSAFVNEDFRFRQLLTGAKEQLPRWKRCLRATDGALGEALGAEWVKTHFDAAAKKRALALVENLEATLENRLGTLAWMSDSTRREAITKLRAFREKIGYPDHWRDYSTMTLARGPFYENQLAANRFEVRRNLDKIGRPVDRTEWRMTPPTVNAYYSATMNEIVFPAGILQPPFFDPAADDAVNYGATGATIGHEMTHGFDDRGRQFDARGNLRDWWTARDAERYKQQAARVVEQFDAFIATDTLHVNGRLTVGENIADLGGLMIAYQAFQRSLEGKPRPPLLDGLTAEQRFFIAYAQSWRELWRPERARTLTATDPHAPPKWRTNGPLQNLPEFAKAFGCKAGDPMVRDEDARIAIW